MRLDELSNYVARHEDEGMIKIEVTMESPEEVTGFYVMKTKETYSFGDEQAADDKINEVRQNPGFAAATKKYKAGKLNRAGDVVKPETWQVVITLNH